MLPNRLAFVALGVACVAAAAGGGYLATRQNAVPVPAVAAATSSPASADAPAAVPAAPAPAPKQEVQASEAAGERNTVPPVTSTPNAATRSSMSHDKPAARAPEPRPSRARLPSEQVARQDAPPLDPPAPTAAAQMPIASPPTAATPPVPGDPAAAADDANQDPGAPPEPQKVFQELVVPADSVIGLQTDVSISSERARVEDRVNGRVTRDVRVNNRVAIPAGTKATGTVTLVERGGKFKERARLGIRFDSLLLADGTRLPISTETIYREGDEPTSAAKVGGGAVGGAILGAILGGGKGALIGGMAGAGAGSAAVMAGDRNAAVLPAGATMTVRVLSPVTVTLDREKE
jgi:hypothetical protein